MACPRVHSDSALAIVLKITHDYERGISGGGSSWMGRRLR